MTNFGPSLRAEGEAIQAIYRIEHSFAPLINNYATRHSCGSVNRFLALCPPPMPPFLLMPLVRPQLSAMRQHRLCRELTALCTRHAIAWLAPFSESRLDSR